jgi:hypothetical protein
MKTLVLLFHEDVSKSERNKMILDHLKQMNTVKIIDVVKEYKSKDKESIKRF